MGTTTTSYGFYKPAIGEKNWGTEVNDSFDEMDLRIKANADAAAAVDVDLQATKASIVLLSSIITGEELTVSADRKTCTTANSFIAGHKRIYVGDSICFDYTETLPTTIVLDNAVDPEIKVRADYIKSS